MSAKVITQTICKQKSQNGASGTRVRLCFRVSHAREDHRFLDIQTKGIKVKKVKCYPKEGMAVGFYANKNIVSGPVNSFSSSSSLLVIDEAKSVCACFIPTYQVHMHLGSILTSNTLTFKPYQQDLLLYSSSHFSPNYLPFILEDHF